MPNPTLLNRRALLRHGAVLSAVAAAGTTLSACSPPESGRADGVDSTADPAPSASSASAAPATGSNPKRILLAYFSRAGENYYRGGRRDLEVGNTEVLSRQIASLISCELYRIEEADPYPKNYDATVDRNVREQDDNARPRIAGPPPTIEQYDTVLLGSPIWNVRPPMIMRTFLESHDFTGKRVLPFVTYAVSGLGSTQDVYAAALPSSDVRTGLAVQGEEAADHQPDVEAWLQANRLTA